MDPGDLAAGVDGWRSRLNPVVNKRNILNGLLKQLNGPKDDDTAIVAKKVVELQSELQHAPASTKQPIRLKHDGQSKVLQVLSGKDPKDYTLYIVGHCAPGSDSLLNKRGRLLASEKIKAKDLASRMGSDGLPKDIFHIKLLACYGARADAAHGYKAYAEELFIELQSYCTNFRLTGYKEPVLLSEFYNDATAPMKTFAKITLGTIIPSSVPIGGRLSSQREDYRYQKLCAVCGKPADKHCGQCKTTSYCGAPCQRAHWPVHKMTCKKA
jgi:hypothetical protein